MSSIFEIDDGTATWLAAKQAEAEGLARQARQEEREAGIVTAVQAKTQEKQAQQALRTAPEGEVTAGIA